MNSLLKSMGLLLACVLGLSVPLAGIKKTLQVLHFTESIGRKNQ